MSVTEPESQRQQTISMKISYHFHLFSTLRPLHGAICLSCLLSSCGQDEKTHTPGAVQTVGGDNAAPVASDPMESYEELLAKRLSDVEQMAALIDSVHSRESAMNVIQDLSNLLESQKAYDVAYAKLMEISPDIKQVLKQKNAAFRTMLIERANVAYGRIMDSLWRIYEAGFYQCEELKTCLDKYGLRLTDEKMAGYLNKRMVAELKDYLDIYESMVQTLEGIKDKTMAEVQAPVLESKARLIKDRVDKLRRLEFAYEQWLPALEQHYRGALDELRIKADENSKRAFRTVVQLASSEMHDSATLQNVIAWGMEMKRPRTVEFQTIGDNPIPAMEEYGRCLENIRDLLLSIKDVKAADKRAMLIADDVAHLKSVRECIKDFQKSGQHDAQMNNVAQQLIKRTADTEAAISAAIADLELKTDIVHQSLLLSNALKLYRQVMSIR